MRDREVIEREMFKARENLEQNLAELKHAVTEKVDVKARARVAVEKGKLMASDALERSKVAAKEYAVRSRDAAKDYAVRGKEAVIEYAERGKEGARQLLHNGEDRVYFTYLKAKDRPVLTASIILGVVATGVLVYVGGRRKCWW